MVLGRSYPLLHGRRRGRRVRDNCLQRRQAGCRGHGREGGFSVFQVELGDDDPATSRGHRCQAAGHCNDGPSGQRRDHAARGGSLQGGHQDDVPERSGRRCRRQVRRRLCRGPAEGAGPRARRGGLAPSCVRGRRRRHRHQRFRPDRARPARARKSSRCSRPLA